MQEAPAKKRWMSFRAKIDQIDIVAKAAYFPAGGNFRDHGSQDWKHYYFEA
jgi:hypothetical protein